jgi:hypothetical protein
MYGGDVLRVGQPVVSQSADRRAGFGRASPSYIHVFSGRLYSEKSV